MRRFVRDGPVVSARSRRRQREQGTRKQPGETKGQAANRGIKPAANESRPWRAPLRKIMSRKRVELKKAGYG